MAVVNLPSLEPTHECSSGRPNAIHGNRITGSHVGLPVQHTGLSTMDYSYAYHDPDPSRGSCMPAPFIGGAYRVSRLRGSCLHVIHDCHVPVRVRSRGCGFIM